MVPNSVGGMPPNLMGCFAEGSSTICRSHAGCAEFKDPRELVKLL